MNLTNGTEKQIAWAEKIATQAIESFDSLGAVGDSDSKEDRIGRSHIKALRLQPATGPDEIRDVATWLRQQTDALWWINSRDYGFEGLVATYRGRPEDCQYPLPA